MTEPTAEIPPRKPRRRWAALSLRGLMLLILVVGGLMGWKARRAHLQRQAVAAIERLGGKAGYDWEDERTWRRSGLGVTITPSQPTGPNAPLWLSKLIGNEYFQEVSWVYLEEQLIPHLEPIPPDPPQPGMSRDESSQYDAEVKSYENQLRQYEEVDRPIIDRNRARSQNELACVDGLDRLESLRIDMTLTTPEGRARLGRMPRLRKLWISTNQLDTGTLEAIGRLVQLEELTIWFDTPISDFETQPIQCDLAPLGRLTKLRTLILRHIKFAQADIDRLPSLEQLSLDGDDLTDESLAKLTKWDGLRVLLLDGSTRITDLGLSHLAGKKQMRNLSFNATRGITDVGIGHLAGFDEMWNFEAKSADQITDAGLAILARLKRLNFLGLDSAAKITDAGLDHLRVSGLKYFTLPGTRLTDRGLARLQSTLPGLQIHLRAKQPVYGHPNSTDVTTPPSPF